MKEHLIFWSPVAEETYLKTLSQILERWTIKEAGKITRKQTGDLFQLGS